MAHQYPNAYPFARKTTGAGDLALPYEGSPSFLSEVVTNLPGKKFRLVASGSTVTAYFELALTAGEQTTLTQAHTDWTPVSNRRYTANFEVETVLAGRTQKIEWFETDNGDGTYSGLSKDAVYTWTGSNLISKVTTEYRDDGTPILSTQVTETYFTTGTGQRVRKVT